MDSVIFALFGTATGPEQWWQLGIVTAPYPLHSKAVLYIGAGALSAVGIAVLYVFDPRVPGNYPVCPFLSLTGCYCPGCGTLRALHRLLHGDVASALGYNPLTVLLVPFLAYSFLTSALRAFHLPAPRQTFVHPRWIWALLVGLIVFWALRNLPVAPFTVLAP